MMPSQKFFKIVDCGDKFIRFSNADGKRWIMPVRKIRTAMNLYQPSGIKGKLVKVLLPYTYWVRFVRRFIHAKILKIELREDLFNLIQNILYITDLQYSIFEGTPSVHQKPTIQLSQGRKILAYCKISDNADIIHLFKNEQQTLDYLRDKGVRQIPRCLFCDKMDDELYLFIQSTQKSNQSKVIHRWTNQHQDFIQQLYECTKIRCRFEDTDFAKSLNRLESYIGNFPVSDSTILKASISKVRNYYGCHSEVEFSAYHGDFTPWNMFFERGELFVFDFEYYLNSFPPYLDAFHFITQIAILEKGLNVGETYNDYCVFRKSSLRYIMDTDVKYISYLLFIISFYCQRNSRSFINNDRSYKCWIGLIERLLG